MGVWSWGVGGGGVGRFRWDDGASWGLGVSGVVDFVSDEIVVGMNERCLFVGLDD